MPFQPVPNTAIFEFRHIWDSQKVENTLYGRFTVPWTAADLVVACDELRQYWVANMLPLMSSAVTLNSVYGRSLETVTAPLHEDFTSAGTPGSVAAPALPNSNSWCITLRTGLSGRSGRGRNYILGLAEDRVTANVVSQAHADAWAAAYAGLTAVWANIGATWVIVSRRTGGAARPSGVTYPVTSSGYIDRIVDSQRRRLPGRGD